MSYYTQGTYIPYDEHSREGNAAGWAAKAYQDIFGRAPTAAELSAALPSFLGSDKNVTDTGSGNAFVSSQKQIGDASTKQKGDTEALAQSQYNETMKQLPTDVANTISQENPQIMEQLNSGGLLTSSAYPQEIARQQSYLTQNLAGQALAQKQGGYQAALNTGQALDLSGLQRGFSLQDYAAQGNLARQLAGQYTPQTGGKGGGSGALAGGAAGATAGAPFGPWAAGGAGISGALLGGLSKSRSGGK